MDKTQEIREALNDVDLDAYEDYAFENVMHKSKARICANAPEWLSYLLTELDAANERLETQRAATQLRQKHVETLQQRFKQVEEAIQVAYNIAYENFETVNQMDLIRLTLGDTLSIIRGEAKEGNQ